MDTINGWEEYLRAERRFSPLTVRAYTDDLKAFVRYTEIEIEEFDPISVSFSELRSYVMYLVERGDNSRSVNRRISSLKSYFKYLIRSGKISSDPTLKLKTLPQQSRLPEFISQKNSDQIVRRLIEWSDDPEERRNNLMVLMLFTTGIRRSELISLERHMVDTEQKKIRVMGKGGKEREIPLLPQVSLLLERFLQNDTENNICENDKKFVFLTNKNRPVSADEIYRIVRKVLAEAGVQGKISPHVLRHTFATHLMAEGASLRSIQELLGHASLSSTEIYTHNTIEKLKESYEKAHPRAKKL